MYPRFFCYGTCSINLPLTKANLNDCSEFKLPNVVETTMTFTYTGTYRRGDVENYSVTIDTNGKITVNRQTKLIPTCLSAQNIELSLTGIKDGKINGKFISHLPSDTGTFSLVPEEDYIEPSSLCVIC